MSGVFRFGALAVGAAATVLVGLLLMTVQQQSTDGLGNFLLPQIVIVPETTEALEPKKPKVTDSPTATSLRTTSATTTQPRGSAPHRRSAGGSDSDGGTGGGSPSTPPSNPPSTPLPATTRLMDGVADLVDNVTGMTERVTTQRATLVDKLLED